MAENPIVRELAAHRAFESIQVINAFADKRPFLKEILIHIRDRARVGVNARIAGKYPGEARSAGAGKTHRHARLQNTVTVHHSPALRVVDGMIEWMRQRPR